jgi:hypothetical protein
VDLLVAVEHGDDGDAVRVSPSLEVVALPRRRARTSPELTPGLSSSGYQSIVTVSA